jgi:two-component system response regulator HydG
MPTKEIPREAMARLVDYRWPGNIRELKHAIERAVIVGEADYLRAEDFPVPRAAAPAEYGRGGDLESQERAAIGSCLEKAAPRANWG